MKLAFVTSNYPTRDRPAFGTFVQQFVWAMARLGHECHVINPVSICNRKLGPLPPDFCLENAGTGAAVSVHHPRYASYSSKNLGFTHTGVWSNRSFAAAALKIASRLPDELDLVYGHFLYPGGYSATQLAAEMGVPSVVGVGEGEFWTLEASGLDRAKRQMRSATGFLAVSTYLASELARVLNVPPHKIMVEPNGVDLALFSPHSSAKGYEPPSDIASSPFLIGYMGPRVEKKGYPQLREAIQGLRDVGLVILSREGCPSNDPFVAFCGPVPHVAVADYLRACDIFVLPTAVEGSCNSVIEAMACGLPVVTSTGQHMDDIVDDSVAIRVDPADIDAIREAIRMLMTDSGLRTRMSEACVRKALELDIGERARRVTDWMEQLVRRYKA